MASAVDIGLVTGCERIRYGAYVGHLLYARRHGLECHLEFAPFEHARGYFHKMAALRAHLAKHDWVVWVDDDAFITDIESDFIRREVTVADSKGSWLVIAPSVPDELNGAWGAYNTGVFALRNTTTSDDLLAVLRDPPLAEIESWWDHDQFGVFTHGDQDVLVWFVETQGHAAGVHWVDPLGWNARPWSYVHGLSDSPVCHFPGHPDKTLSIRDFAKRWGTDETLIRTEAPTLHQRGLHAQVPSTTRSGAALRRLSLRRRATWKRARLKLDWVRHHRRWS